jgi:TusA-related sulfurtransferase
MLEPDEILDLSGVPCPKNSARALLKLEIMSSGEILQVIVDDGEPIENVPSSLEVEGHTVEEREQRADTRWVLSVRVA